MMMMMMIIIRKIIKKKKKKSHEAETARTQSKSCSKNGDTIKGTKDFTYLGVAVSTLREVVKRYG